MFTASSSSRQINPLTLLAGGAALHMGYSLAQLEHQAMAWNALGALARLALVLALVYPITTPFMGAVVALIAAEELQVVVCNLAYTVAPWEVKPGQEMCSSWVKTDLGKYSAIAAAAILITYKPLQVT